MNEDFRRIANRIRDAYTLDEAEQILKQAVIDEIAFYKKNIDLQDSWQEIKKIIEKEWKIND